MVKFSTEGQKKANSEKERKKGEGIDEVCKKWRIMPLFNTII